MTAALNESAPDFELPDLSGGRLRLSGLLGRIVVLNFWSCECPHSERTDKAIQGLQAAWGQDVMLLTIASNRSESEAAIRAAAEARRLPIVLLDTDCQTADLYEAQTTPHIFIVDRSGVLRYRGAVDDVSFRSRVPTRSYLDEAVESLRNGNLPPAAEWPAYGCAIVREV